MGRNKKPRKGLFCWLSKRMRVIKHFVYNTQHPLTEQQLEDAKNYDLVLLDCSLDPAPWAQDIKIEIDNYIVLSPDWQYWYNPTDRIKFYNHWLFNQIRRNSYHQLSDHRQYDISCLNRAPRLERIYNIQQMRKQPWFDKCLTSFYNVDPYGNTVDAPLLNPLNENQKELNDHSLRHPAYSDSYCNYVTETTMQHPFFSEKSIKPILAEQVFFINAYPGLLKFFKDLGIDVFDDVIDISYNQGHWQDSINRCHSEIEKFLNLKLSLLERCKKNKQYLLSTEFKQAVLPELHKLL